MTKNISVMSKREKSPDIEKLDAGRVASVTEVDEKDIPAGVEVKEGVELVGDDAEIARVVNEAEAAASAPPTYEQILQRIKEAQVKEA